MSRVQYVPFPLPTVDLENMSLDAPLQLAILQLMVEWLERIRISSFAAIVYSGKNPKEET
jgi:hypothetical protein